MTYDEAVSLLSAAGIYSACDEAEELFCTFGGYGRSTFHLMYRVESDSPRLIEAVHRRAKREPLQYILGRAYFYRECYKVTPDCLIPRFDTENLVDYVVKNLPDGGEFIDLCTGSGCIALSVLNNTKNTRAIALDISEGALSVARENAESLELCDRVEFIQGDALSQPVGGMIDALLSNPPYVTEEAYRTLDPEIYFEPEAAFVGGVDGGDFYRRITPMYKDRLKEGGFIAYEIGYDQEELIRAVAADNAMTCQIIKDLSGHPRVAVLKK